MPGLSASLLAWRKRQPSCLARKVAGVLLAMTCTLAASPLLAAADDPRPGAMAQVLGRTDRLLVISPAPGDQPQALAERFLGSRERAWWLGAPEAVVAGQPLVVPLVHPNPIGFNPEGFQTVPIVSYHRFGPAASAQVVTPEQFEAQLQWLVESRLHVARLADLPGFLAGRDPLPPHTVAIVIDDGHESFLRHAWPLLQKYRLPVTLFVHTDAVGTRDFLSWDQLRDMAASGLVSIQAHSKTHQNLAVQQARETDLAYRRRLEVEVQTSRRQIEQMVPGASVNQFAHPFGDASPALLDTLQRNAFELGLSARPGGNPFYRPPFLLQRTLVLGTESLEEFKVRIQTRGAWAP
jgi:peptidoglycan/xylan/chitin deacetylase (PgdA/CDA1 family)